VIASKKGMMMAISIVAVFLHRISVFFYIRIILEESRLSAFDGWLGVLNVSPPTSKRDSSSNSRCKILGLSIACHRSLLSALRSCGNSCSHSCHIGHWVWWYGHNNLIWQLATLWLTAIFIFVATMMINLQSRAEILGLLLLKLIFFICCTSIKVKWVISLKPNHILSCLWLCATYVGSSHPTKLMLKFLRLNKWGCQILCILGQLIYPFTFNFISCNGTH
jgi:hypothetical protein